MHTMRPKINHRHTHKLFSFNSLQATAQPGRLLYLSDQCLTSIADFDHLTLSHVILGTKTRPGVTSFAVAGPTCCPSYWRGWLPVS